MAYRVRPSQAPVWIHCPGSIQMQERYPEPSGPEAEEGTAAHWVLAESLRGRSIVAGSVAPNGIVISEDMLEGAGVAHNVVVGWMIPVVVEVELPATWIHEQAGGTPDVWGYDRVQRLIRVLDFKFGFKIVEPFENWQLLCYLSAILLHLGVSDLDHEVEFTIVQPRANHREGEVRTWRFRACDVRAQLNKLASRAAQAMGPNPPCIPGSYCGDCSGRHACATLQENAYIAAAIAGQIDPFDLNPQAAARELMRLEEALALIQARVDGLRVQVESDITKGAINPFYDIENAVARRVWREGMEETAIGIAAASGINIMKPRRAITPTQAMKLLPEEVVRDMSYRPNGERKLVRRDISKMRKLFGG